MNGADFRISGALALLCALLMPVLLSGESGGEFGDVSARIVRYAAANNINKISVLPFMPKAGVEKNEAEYISEAIGSRLAGYKKPALIERALLEKVLKEARLSSSAGGAEDKAGMFRDIFSVDAVVTGTVFAAGGKLRVLTRLIDVRTGSVLLAARSETEREWPQLPDLPALPDGGFEWDAGTWVLPPADLRDALAEPAENSCESRKLRLARLNSELVDEKALYWAARMKEPGFSVRSLTRNPGSEISDPEVKARFYKLLNSYYKAGNVPRAGPDEPPALANLLKEEAAVADDCGTR